MDSGEEEDMVAVRASLPSPALEITKDVVDDQLGLFVNVPDVRGRSLSWPFCRDVFHRVIRITVHRGSLQGRCQTVSSITAEILSQPACGLPLKETGRRPGNGGTWRPSLHPPEPRGPGQICTWRKWAPTGCLKARELVLQGTRPL